MNAGSNAACTPLQSLLRSSPVADSVAADFRKATWTFKVSAPVPVGPGRYLLVPEVIARLALENETAGGAGVHILPIHQVEASFSNYDGAIDLDGYDGSELAYTLRRCHVPPKYPRQWHPARWTGRLMFKAQDGKRYQRTDSSHYVQDDFGQLVEVPV